MKKISKNFKFSSLIALMLTVVSCTDFLVPNKADYIDENDITQSKDFFMGVLNRSYLGIPTRINLTYEATTDNLIANNENSTTSKASKGGITAQNNPLGDTWANDYTYINYVNWYFEHMTLDFTKVIPTPVKFNDDKVINLKMYYYTLGEAYFLRAWYEFDLLQKYGGVAADGKVYGFPIRTTYYKGDEDLNLPRNTYAECLNQIIQDCDSAFRHLPLDYKLADANLFEGNVSNSGHASGIAAKALKAKALLYAASPAYNLTNDIELWRRAAQASMEAIQLSGGNIALLTYPNYFNKIALNNNDYSNKDMFFRGPINVNTSALEKENFPPRVQGNGTYNPTQNLIDAFPKSDGFPAEIASSVIIDQANPYLRRDPRLDRFILRNGESYATITLATTTGGSDAMGAQLGNTRTGYYVQKLLDGSVRFTSPNVTTTMAPILLGKAELYLTFAEAVFMATGDMNSTVYTYTPKEIIKRIRERVYGVSADKYYVNGNFITSSNFLDFVKNERRLELCFEDHRFWDLRRWCNGKDDIVPLSFSVYGIYKTEAIENRSFKSPYLPLPFAEVLKSSKLVNNVGY